MTQFEDAYLILSDFRSTLIRGQFVWFPKSPSKSTPINFWTISKGVPLWPQVGVDPENQLQMSCVARERFLERVKFLTKNNGFCEILGKSRFRSQSSKKSALFGVRRQKSVKFWAFHDSKSPKSVLISWNKKRQWLGVKISKWRKHRRNRDRDNWIWFGTSFSGMLRSALDESTSEILQNCIQMVWRIHSGLNHLNLNWGGGLVRGVILAAMSSELG